MKFQKCYPEAYEDLFDDDFDLEDACRRIESGAGKVRTKNIYKYVYPAVTRR